MLFENLLEEFYNYKFDFELSVFSFTYNPHKTRNSRKTKF